MSVCGGTNIWAAATFPVVRALVSLTACHGFILNWRVGTAKTGLFSSTVFLLSCRFPFFLMPWCNADNHDLFFHLFVINIYSQVGTLPSFWRFVHQSKFNVLRLHSYKHTNAYSHIKHHRKFRHWLEKQRKKKAETEQMQHTAQSNNLWADFTQTTFFRQ